MRVYTYVIVNDAGSAPNYDEPSVTLAVCKPRIRLGAQVGDLVLAFTGRTLGAERHAVRWAGIVGEKLTFSEYWRDKRFQSKKPGQSSTPDNLYKPTARGPRQVRNSTHSLEHAPRDLGGQFVLVFDRMWHFGEAVVVLPAKFGLRMSARRGHRVFDFRREQARQLLAWLDDEQPTWRPARRRGRGRGCGITSRKRSC